MAFFQLGSEIVFSNPARRGSVGPKRTYTEGAEEERETEAEATAGRATTKIPRTEQARCISAATCGKEVQDSVMRRHVSAQRTSQPRSALDVLASFRTKLTAAAEELLQHEAEVYIDRPQEEIRVIAHRFTGRCMGILEEEKLRIDQRVQQQRHSQLSQPQQQPQQQQ